MFRPGFAPDSESDHRQNIGIKLDVRSGSDVAAAQAPTVYIAAPIDIGFRLWFGGVESESQPCAGAGGIEGFQPAISNKPQRSPDLAPAR